MLLESALARALVPTILSVAIGVLSGSLVTEITTPRGLDWSHVHSTVSFYGLILSTVLQGMYAKLLYGYEQEVLKFADTEYCIAYLRARCLPELAARAQERIRNGEGGEFKAAIEEIRQVLQ